MARRTKKVDMDFARTLRRLMEERSIGVSELAKRCGCAASSISNYRQGVAPTDFKLIRRLANELGTTLSFLLTGEDDSRPAGSELSVAEVFTDGGPLFDGYARISIQRLIPKGKKDPSGGSDG